MGPASSYTGSLGGQRGGASVCYYLKNMDCTVHGIGAGGGPTPSTWIAERCTGNLADQTHVDLSFLKNATRRSCLRLRPLVTQQAGVLNTTQCTLYIKPKNIKD
jgi:hypothetical protein